MKAGKGLNQVKNWVNFGILSAFLIAVQRKNNQICWVFQKLEQSEEKFLNFIQKMFTNDI